MDSTEKSLGSRKLMAMAGGAVAALVVVSVIFVLVKRAHDPLRTPIPDKSAPISAIQPQLDKLDPPDRQLLVGYLLLQRGEIASLSTRGIAFPAKTFREAIAAQKAVLAQKQASPEFLLMRMLEETSLRPLREAVPLQLVARPQTTMGELVKANTGAVIVGSGGAPNEVRTVMVYRIANPGKVAITHLTGYIQPQLASDDWVSAALPTGLCRIDLKNIAPGASVQVICAQIELNAFGDASKTPDDRLTIDWRPDVVEYADGTKLDYATNAGTYTLVWNHYSVDGFVK